MKYLAVGGVPGVRFEAGEYFLIGVCVEILLGVGGGSKTGRYPAITGGGFSRSSASTWRASMVARAQRVRISAPISAKEGFVRHHILNGP